MQQLHAAARPPGPPQPAPSEMGTASSNGVPSAAANGVPHLNGSLRTGQESARPPPLRPFALVDEVSASSPAADARHSSRRCAHILWRCGCWGAGCPAAHRTSRTGK
eukprot:jgi/Botrbrau1/22982/Bobra.0030s0048.1